MVGNGISAINSMLVSGKGTSLGQWLLFLVPLKGGIGSIFHPPEGKDYKWYISGIFPAN